MWFMWFMWFYHGIGLILSISYNYISAIAQWCAIIYFAQNFIDYQGFRLKYLRIWVVSVQFCLNCSFAKAMAHNEGILMLKRLYD